MPFDPRTHFQQACNKRRIHIEELRSTRDDDNTADVVRQRLNKKIAREKELLAVLDEVWDVQ